MIRYEIRHHFADYVTREMTEREFHPWYVAYYSETGEAFLRSCLKKKCLPRITSLIMIAELFECSVNELLGFEYVEVDSRNRLFDSGMDTPHIVDYFMDQIASRGLDIDNIAFNEPDSEEDIRRSVRLRRLPKTDTFMQICDALNCTPSHLLGY